jgi:hypothetical protein
VLAYKRPGYSMSPQATYRSGWSIERWMLIA